MVKDGVLSNLLPLLLVRWRRWPRHRCKLRRLRLLQMRRGIGERVNEEGEREAMGRGKEEKRKKEIFFVLAFFQPPCQCMYIHRWMGHGAQIKWTPHLIQWQMCISTEAKKMHVHNTSHRKNTMRRGRRLSKKKEKRNKGRA